MGPIRPKQPELFAFEFRKIAKFDFVYSSICKYRSISTKRGRIIYDQQISEDFDFMSN